MFSNCQKKVSQKRTFQNKYNKALNATTDAELLISFANSTTLA